MQSIKIQTLAIRMSIPVGIDWKRRLSDKRCEGDFSDVLEGRQLMSDSSQ